jgi:hypothetical protein
MIFAVFSRIFPESWISAQIRDTRAILLKTASVHVSCTQNTHIRGETIAKVFRKVDIFWTFQFSCQGEYIGGRVVSGGGPGGPTTWWCGPGAGCAILWWGWPLAPLRLCFGLRLVSGKIGTSAFVLSNSENISCVAFLKHKNSRK